MSSQCITVGIDLGTTNSKMVANIDGKLEVIKKPGEKEYIPSVFGFDKNGNEVVGQKAYDLLYRFYEKGAGENIRAEVKRKMGSTETLWFPKAKVKMTPEEWSAEILKSLKEELLRRYPDFDTTSVVITVPAAFSVLHSEATKRAGNLAGFKYVVLLQEPIAAAISYGFMNAKNENWLIYDFGGGTFDLALVSCKDGVLSVLGHGGKPYLGGKDIDAEIVKKVLVPKLLEKYNFKDFKKGSQRYDDVFPKLKYAAETAKIDLSQYSKTTIEVENAGKDDSGKEVYLSIPFTKDEFNKLIEPIIDQTIELSRDAIKDAGLKESSVKRIILVGGTSLIPFIKEKLKKAFDISVDSSIDPITAVASGACIFAMGQKIPEEFLQSDAKKLKHGVHQIKLNYASLTSDNEESVTGNISGLDAKAEYYVKIQSDSGTFTGPKTKLNNGKFYCIVKVQKNKQNLYWVYAFDNKSNPVKIDPDSFTITHGLSVSGAPLPHSIQVVVADLTKNINFCEPIFEKEVALPLSKTIGDYKTSRKLEKGEENPLNIAIVEGEDDDPRLNEEVCELGINGKDIPHDLPAGTPIQLEVKINESREVTVTAYIPIIDASKSINARMPQHDEEVNAEDISTDLLTQRKRAESVFEYCSEDERKKINNSIQSVSESVSSAGNDKDEKRKASSELKNLKSMLKELEEEKKMPQSVKEYNLRVEQLEKIINEYADPKQRDDFAKQLKNIKTDAEIAIKENNKTLMNRINEQLINLSFAAVYSNPNSWIAYFQQIVNADNFTNEKEAEYYISKGKQAIGSKDYEELKRCALELNKLRPVSEQKEVNLSGITH